MAWASLVILALGGLWCVFQLMTFYYEEKGDYHAASADAVLGPTARLTPFAVKPSFKKEKRGRHFEC
jgi:hypothetical protein